jgi:hypothetical protein
VEDTVVCQQDRQAAEVCAEEADCFLIEGFELAPSYPQWLRAALEGMTVRACFLGHGTFSAADLASYRGPKAQHEAQASLAELARAAAWIRQRSHHLRDECRRRGLPYIDVGVLGHQGAMRHARQHLVGT